MGLTLVINGSFFNVYICSLSAIFCAISISDTFLSSRKFISKPNFDKIYQSTAAMNYFRQPYWISISGLYFDRCVVISVSFYICLPNFVEIERSAAEF